MLRCLARLAPSSSPRSCWRVRAVIEAQPSNLAPHAARDAYLKDIGDPESLEPTWSVVVDQSLSVQR